MLPSADDSNPSDRQSSNAEQPIEFSARDRHSEVESIVVNAPVATVYACCARFEQLPRFITALREVEKIDNTHFLVTSSLGGERKTVLQIVLRIPERRIVWQTISESFPHGVVSFESLSERMTEITVRMRSNVEEATLAPLTRKCLTDFKRIVEGELPI